MEALGFPMGGNVDTLADQQGAGGLDLRQGNAARLRRQGLSHPASLGDNFGDFSDGYKGTEAERQAAFEEASAHWGHDWLMLPNPSYGSFESAPFGHDFKQSADKRRNMKIGVLQTWVAPAE